MKLPASDHSDTAMTQGVDRYVRFGVGVCQGLSLAIPEPVAVRAPVPVLFPNPDQSLQLSRDRIVSDRPGSEIPFVILGVASVDFTILEDPCFATH